MQEALQKQYEQIRTAITSNIATIQTMINQADSLQRIVETISDSEDSSKKEQLRKEVENINSSISTLITNTNSLFALYDGFVRTVVNQK